MKKCFFIHGKPSEKESTSENKFEGLEERIADEFFQRLPPEECMVLEIRRWKDKYYSLYSYYKDGKDFGQRPNGYCILTLIVEGQYSIQTAKIYNLLDLVYNTGLISNLKYIDNQGIYLITTFRERKEIKALENEVYGRLDEQDFRQIEKSSLFENQTNVPMRFNPYDVDSVSFFDILRNNRKVYISQSYKTLSQEQKSLIKKIESSSALKVEMDQENEQLKSRIQNLEDELKDKARPKVTPLTPIQPQGYDQIAARFDLIDSKLKQILDSKTREPFSTSFGKDFILSFLKSNLVNLIILATILICTIFLICNFNKLGGKNFADTPNSANASSQFNDANTSEINIYKTRCDSLENELINLKALSRSDLIVINNISGSSNLSSGHSYKISFNESNISKKNIRFDCDSSMASFKNNTLKVGQKTGKLIIEVYYNNTVYSIREFNVIKSRV